MGPGGAGGGGGGGVAPPGGAACSARGHERAHAHAPGTGASTQACRRVHKHAGVCAHRCAHVHVESGTCVHRLHTGVHGYGRACTQAAHACTHNHAHARTDCTPACTRVHSHACACTQAAHVHAPMHRCTCTYQRACTCLSCTRTCMHLHVAHAFPSRIAAPRSHWLLGPRGAKQRWFRNSPGVPGPRGVVGVSHGAQGARGGRAALLCCAAVTFYQANILSRVLQPRSNATGIIYYCFFLLI